jgi:hypothetical protein
MKILIIGTLRSGTTALMNAIGNGMNLTICNEPFLKSNTNTIYDSNQNDIVLKTMIHHQSFDEMDELRNSFDKTILLSRKDTNAVWESVCNAIYERDVLSPNDDEFKAWAKPYTHNKDALNSIHKIGVHHRLNLIIKYSFHSNMNIMWYEDLFSSNMSIAKSTFDSIGLNLSYDNVYEYLNPSKKYRK